MDYSQHSFNNPEWEQAWRNMSFRMQRPELPIFHCDLEPHEYAWAVLLLDAMKTIEDAADDLTNPHENSRMAAARTIAAEYFSPSADVQRHIANMGAFFKGGCSGGSVEFHHNARLAIISASAILPALRLLGNHAAIHHIEPALTRVVGVCKRAAYPELEVLGKVLGDVLTMQSRSDALR
jgi:hypothetical protein